MREITCGSVVKFISFLFVIAELKIVHGIPLSISQENGNNVQRPTSGNLTSNRNNSRLHINITSNELSTEQTQTSKSFVKISSTNLPTTHTTGDTLGGFESSSANMSNITTTARTSTSNRITTFHIISENYTTVSPSPSIVAHKHHFNMNILDYILIPVGCLLAIVISYCLVRHVQKVRRKRRLERELLHQYSYPNSEADDTEEQNIGDLESIVNTQFVAFSDRSDKNLYEDSPEVTLAFDESSKLVVQEPAPPSPSEDLEASTSFTS
ncbi:hypothetical protein ACROYT_G032742 [Oculina patagonica]